MKDLLSAVKQELKEIEDTGIHTSNLFTLEKLSVIYKNLSTVPIDDEDAEEVVEKYSNNMYDRNLNELYDSYIASKKVYQASQSLENKDKMIDSLSRLLTEISDLTTLIWNDSSLMEEKDLINRMLELISRH